MNLILCIKTRCMNIHLLLIRKYPLQTLYLQEYMFVNGTFPSVNEILKMCSHKHYLLSLTNLMILAPLWLQILLGSYLWVDRINCTHNPQKSLCHRMATDGIAASEPEKLENCVFVPMNSE